MKLIVGLGNPGNEYKNTRHNMGFRALDFFADSKNLKFDKKKFNGIFSEYNYNGEKVILLKPQSYINLSGDVIKKFVDFYKIDVSDILIICDDLDTAVGKVKIKYKGGSGGHNGLKNIEYNLKTQEYKRIKIGISNNKKIDTKDYVLGKIDEDTNKEIDKIINLIPEMIDNYLSIPFDNVMNKYNK